VRERGNVLAALAVVDQFPGVGDLLPGKFWLGSEFRAVAFVFTQERVRSLIRLRGGLIFCGSPHGSMGSRS
jgi:hypothetical protein